MIIIISGLITFFFFKEVCYLEDRHKYKNYLKEGGTDSFDKCMKTWNSTPMP